ncbi:MAG: hypothetical protein AAB531_04295 [Patescibacteria group bacterium]
MPNKQKNKHRRSIPIIATLGLIALFAVSNIQITQNLATTSSQYVLGEGDESEEQKQAEEAAKETAKQAEETQKESAKQIEEQQKEAAKTTTTETWRPSSKSGSSTKSKTETISPSGLKMKTETEGNKQETEIETADGQKIKTKIEDDGTTKIEIENGTIKLKYRIENGQLVLKVENEDGDEVEIEEDELEELERDVEDELEDDDVRLLPTTDNQLALAQNQTAAFTEFPLSINVETKELIITTPAGQKIVTVLPDEAVQNLLATGIISKIDIPSSDITTQDQFGALTGVVKIELRNNEVVYKVKGTKTHRMLGIIPVSSPVTAFVSTDTGVTVAKQQSILANVIDFLSP